MKILLAQINLTVGDIAGNLAKIAQGLAAAEKAKADLVVFPEMTVTGYPPEDLLLKPGFIHANRLALKNICSLVKNLTAVVGFVDAGGGRLYNAAAVIERGRIVAIYHKNELPNYGVFDERRYFAAGTKELVVKVKGKRIGLSICEDIWQKSSFVYRKDYPGTIDALINISASPYHVGKIHEREKLVGGLAKRLKKPVFYLNLVGGQDELVFDGASLIADEKGQIRARGKQFAEDFLATSLPLGQIKNPAKPLEREREVYEALVLGTRDYVKKNKFKKAVLGLSGGIDSALVASIAVDALGAENVEGVTMPSDFTSSETLSDAKLLAENLGIVCHEISIRDIHDRYLKNLDTLFKGRGTDATEENLQARIRGNLLMAISNKFGRLVLTTGNKSEMATGYCTLYGDMAGGFAVIKDVPKTLVFKLSRYRNRVAERSWIPESIIKRPPTAELRHNQKDQDTLPPYPVLDRFLEDYVEGDLSVEKIGQKGFSKPLAQKISRMVDHSEYKRRQAPPGVKITPKAFGRDRRIPITNAYAG